MTTQNLTMEAILKLDSHLRMDAYAMLFERSPHLLYKARTDLFDDDDLAYFVNAKLPILLILGPANLSDYLIELCVYESPLEYLYLKECYRHTGATKAFLSSIKSMVDSLENITDTDAKLVEEAQQEAATLRLHATMVKPSIMDFEDAMILHYLVPGRLDMISESYLEVPEFWLNTIEQHGQVTMHQIPSFVWTEALLEAAFQYHPNTLKYCNMEYMDDNVLLKVAELYPVIITFLPPSCIITRSLADIVLRSDPAFVVYIPMAILNTLDLTLYDFPPLLWHFIPTDQLTLTDEVFDTIITDHPGTVALIPRSAFTDSQLALLLKCGLYTCTE